MLFNNLMLLAKLPVADWMENFTTWMTNTFAGLFAAIQSGGQATMDGLTDFLLFINPWVWIIGITILAFIISTRRIGITLFSFFGLLFIYNQGLWSDLMNTFTLVLLASLVSIIIGVPLGIWAAKSNRLNPSSSRFWTSCRRCLPLFTLFRQSPSSVLVWFRVCSHP